MKVTGDPDFCQHRDVLEIPAAAAAEGKEDLGGGQEVVDLPEVGRPAHESDADLLGYAIDASQQVAEERHIYYIQDEIPVLRLEEPFNSWEVDSNDGCEAAGEARGRPGPARAADVEQEMEEYLRVATLDIPTLFPRPACDLSCRPDVSAGDAARRLEDYGAECLRLEQAEAEYRARREKAKVWRRERDEDLRRVLEARARQDQVWKGGGGTPGRQDTGEKRGGEDSRGVKEVEREQLEEQKRNEERQQFEERRRKVEEKKKEDKERREVEKQKLEEERRWKRRKEVEAATAQAKKKKKEHAERKELKARVAAEDYNLFLLKEAEREQMLAEEAKAQLVKKSEEANRARMAKAEKDWQELREKE